MRRMKTFGLRRDERQNVLELLRRREEEGAVDLVDLDPDRNRRARATPSGSPSIVPSGASRNSRVTPSTLVTSAMRRMKRKAAENDAHLHRDGEVHEHGEEERRPSRTITSLLGRAQERRRRSATRSCGTPRPRGSPRALRAGPGSPSGRAAGARRERSRHAIMPATGVRPPFFTFVAVRAIAPVAGIPPKSAEAMFATPCPTSSTFDLWRLPIMPSATTAESSDSIAASSATVTAGGKSSRSAPGASTGGIAAAGVRPATRRSASRSSRPGDAADAAAALAATMATIGAGIFRETRGHTSRIASDRRRDPDGGRRQRPDRSAEGRPLLEEWPPEPRPSAGRGDPSSPRKR